MKNPKRLSKKEKIYLKSLCLDFDNWLISKKTMDKWLIVHRETGRLREIPAP